MIAFGVAILCLAGFLASQGAGRIATIGISVGVTLIIVGISK